CRCYCACTASRPRPRRLAFPTRRSSDLEARQPSWTGFRVIHWRCFSFHGTARFPRKTAGTEAGRYRIVEVSHRKLAELPTGKFADRKSTRLNSSHVKISYAVLCLKKKKH